MRKDFITNDQKLIEDEIMVLRPLAYNKSFKYHSIQCFTDNQARTLCNEIRRRLKVKSTWYYNIIERVYIVEIRR